MGFAPCCEFYFRSKVQHTLVVWEVLVYNFIQENLPKEEGLEDKLSGYALKGYKDLAYTEIIAESVTVKNSNVFAEKLLDAIRDGGE